MAYALSRNVYFEVIAYITPVLVEWKVCGRSNDKFHFDGKFYLFSQVIAH